MSVGDFRSPDLHYKGWLEELKESTDLKIREPHDGEVFHTSLGESKKEITVSGQISNKTLEKILIIVRTDRDYPQALGLPNEDGSWEFSGCTLGGVDHLIYAVLVDGGDEPVLRSKVVRVRLERG